VAAPTRAEIQADATVPTYTVEVFSGGSWVDISSFVVNVTPVLEATGGEPTGVAMGPAVLPGCEIELFASTAAEVQTLRGYEPGRPKVRASFGFASSDKLSRFTGLLMEPSGSGRSRRWACRGWDAQIEAQEVRSPLYRRRYIFTATSISSVEDPASGVYAAGLGNYILWQCGGRPYEQAGSYPTATFYYSCTNALISPEYTWCPGDSPWEVLRRLCRAAGGQIYQDGDGVIRYVDPITLATGTPAFTFSDEVLTAAQRVSQGKGPYGGISDRLDAGRAVTGVTVAFVSRILQGEQIVYEDQTPRQIPASSAITVTCDLQLPCSRVTAAERDACRHRSGIEASTTDVTVSVTFPSAQRALATLTNTLTDPVMIYAVRVRGRPLSAGEEGSASYIVSSARVVTAEDSVYVQSQRHAAMLARMVYDGANSAGLIYTLTDCPYDPDRYVGEVVGLTSSDYGLSALRCRVVRITAQGGAWMETELAPLGGLPTRDDVHRVGSVSGTKAMAY
jgi:hypothetical protein